MWLWLVHLIHSFYELSLLYERLCNKLAVICKRGQYFNLALNWPTKTGLPTSIPIIGAMSNVGFCNISSFNN